MKHPELGEKLVYQRKLKGMSQEELAHLSSVGVRTIQRIEKGEVKPHLQTVKLIAEALEIAVEDLVRLQDPSEEPVQRKWLVMIHGAPFLGLLFPFANVFVPLFIWVSKAQDHKVYDKHGRAVINFHATIDLLLIISLLSFFIMPGFNYFITAFIFLFGIIVSLYNLRLAINHHRCRYPLSLPFIKPVK